MDSDLIALTISHSFFLSNIVCMRSVYWNQFLKHLSFLYLLSRSSSAIVDFVYTVSQSTNRIS